MGGKTTTCVVQIHTFQLRKQGNVVNMIDELTIRKIEEEFGLQLDRRFFDDYYILNFPRRNGKEFSSFIKFLLLYGEEIIKN